MTNTAYDHSFFDEIDRIASPDYVPNEMDVLQSRTRTTGINETRLQMGELRISMFDIGEQRSHRNKWLHYVDSVSAMIFVVDLDTYDQVSLEESSQTRMMESLLLFESAVNSIWFRGAGIILFLNKVDILRQKLDRSPLENYFPDYSGGNDLDEAVKYIGGRFNQANRAHLYMYLHVTKLSDLTHIGIVFTEIKRLIVRQAVLASVLFV